MDKLKGMLKISERDKKLLVVVLAVLIMALAYFFGFQNLSDQVDTLSTKKTTLETTQRDLRILHWTRKHMLKRLLLQVM